MSAVDKIATWVQKKPMILIRLDDVFSASLLESKRGFEYLTIVKPHAVLRDFKLPTLCMLEIQKGDGTKCYLATATRKVAVSTFESRLTVRKLRPITVPSLHGLQAKVRDPRMERLLVGRIPVEGEWSSLSPKLSACLVKVLARDVSNQAALDTALSLLPELRRAPHIQWAQEDAIQSAMAAFGLRNSDTATEIALKNGASSGLGLIGAYLYEDNVVHADASHLPGFDVIAVDVTGRAVFQKGDERLVIYTANKLPLEKMLGVDLIYVNETRGNVVMIQYKMLKEDKRGLQSRDWLFRPDKQSHAEISRMRLPDCAVPSRDYRMNRNPFFFKFVKRKVVDDSHQAFVVSLEHLQRILAESISKGPKGGVRISYKALDGTYLRDSDMLGLIRSGYAGTHRAETEALATIIAEVAKGNRAVVLAWQQRIQDEGRRP